MARHNAEKHHLFYNNKLVQFVKLFTDFGFCRKLQTKHYATEAPKAFA